MRPDGMLADTPTRPALGLGAHAPSITTDFSEAQLELITGVHTDVESCSAQSSRNCTIAVYRQLGDEMIWCASMPCRLPQDRIPLARYGKSNQGA